MSEKLSSKIVEKSDRFFPQAAIDFYLNSDESDYDSSVGGLSSAAEDMIDQELLNNDFNNNTR